MDLRVTTPIADMGICMVKPDKDDVGASDPRIVLPGYPERSVLLLRMRDEGLDRMPPLGSDVVHTEAADLVEQWITELTGCE